MEPGMLSLPSAAEKSLKALIAYEGDLPPRTHRLTNLSKSLEDRYPPLVELADNLLVLENYYIPSRYPDAIPGSLPEGLPGRADAQEALTTARRVSALVAETVEPGG